MSDLTIVGAGLAGLIAAHAWPRAQILETSPQPRAGHRALLRFRSEAVGRLTGVEFRRVTVRKGIFAENDFRAPNVRWANLYAQKVLGHGNLSGDRSIWNLDAVERFIAPDDFYELLIQSVGDRVSWNSSARFNDKKLIVSTAPLPVVLEAVGMDAPVEFPRAKIHVTRWRVPGADVFQTVYFPDRGLGVYRASMTGGTMIIESVAPVNDEDCDVVRRAFGLEGVEVEALESVEQRFGKIVPLPAAVRKQLLFRLTHEHNIYSLGRFATWRNILLDDVVDDITTIKRLLSTANNAYDLRRAAS